MKKVFLFSIIIFSLLFCAKNNENPLKGKYSFKIALLLPGSIDDNSWSQSGYEALIHVKNEMKVFTEYSSNVQEKDYHQTIKRYADSGFNLIIAHGAQFEKAMIEAAKNYPETRFSIIANYEGNNYNLSAFQFKNYETGYLCGVIAALKTKTNVVAFIGGKKLSSMISQVVYFSNGAASVNKKITVNEYWTESFDDEKTALECFTLAKNDKADVIYVIADKSSKIIHKAAGENSIYTIGHTRDASRYSPKTVLTSVIENMPALYYECAYLAMAGTMEGKQYKLGFRDNGLYMAPINNMDYNHIVAVENVKNLIIDNKIKPYVVNKQ